MNTNKTEVRELLCAMTEAELLVTGRQLSRVIEEQNKIEADKAIANKEFKDQLDELDTQIYDLAAKIRTKQELRGIECAWQFDWEAGEKSLVRKDTGEIIQRAHISPEERQMELRTP